MHEEGPDLLIEVRILNGWCCQLRSEGLNFMPKVGISNDGTKFTSWRSKVRTMKFGAQTVTSKSKSRYQGLNPVVFMTQIHFAKKILFLRYLASTHFYLFWNLQNSS